MVATMYVTLQHLIGFSYGPPRSEPRGWHGYRPISDSESSDSGSDRSDLPDPLVPSDCGKRWQHAVGPFHLPGPGSLSVQR